MPKRPTTYVAKIADEICQRAAAGEALTAICEPEKMPDVDTVMQWYHDDVEGFKSRYAAAALETINRVVGEILIPQGFGFEPAKFENGEFSPPKVFPPSSEGVQSILAAFPSEDQFIATYAKSHNLNVSDLSAPLLADVYDAYLKTKKAYDESVAQAA